MPINIGCHERVPYIKSFTKHNFVSGTIQLQVPDCTTLHKVQLNALRVRAFELFKLSQCQAKESIDLLSATKMLSRRPANDILARQNMTVCNISGSTSCSFPIKGDAAIRACCCKPFVPSRLWKPFDTPQRFLRLGVRSHTCSLLDRPDLCFPIESSAYYVRRYKGDYSLG